VCLVVHKCLALVMKNREGYSARGEAVHAPVMTGGASVLSPVTRYKKHAIEGLDPKRHRWSPLLTGPGSSLCGTVTNRF